MENNATLTSQKEIRLVINKEIKPRMKKLGITTYRLAKLSAVSEPTVHRFLKGNYPGISLEKYFDILNALSLECKRSMEVKEYQAPYRTRKTESEKVKDLLIKKVLERQRKMMLGLSVGNQDLQNKFDLLLEEE